MSKIKFTIWLLTNKTLEMKAKWHSMEAYDMALD
jgi:hypothetical protein